MAVKKTTDIKKDNTKDKKTAEKKTAAKSSKGLGKGLGSKGLGLGSLIPPVEDEGEEKIVEVIKEVVVPAETELNINLIEPNPDQPRKKFDEDALTELSESIKEHGLIEPIIVQKKGERYIIVAGERRWRACRLAKLKTVPVVIKDYEDKERYEIAIIENVQRQDLNAIEEAMAYQQLIDEYKYKQDEVAVRVSKSRVAITNSLRLLKLDKRVQELIVNDLISGGHARALLSLTSNDQQYEVATKIIDEKMSVRETEKYVKALLNRQEKESKKKTLENEAIYREYENNLRDILGSKVEIQRKGSNKGKIVIEYNSTDEFEKLYDIIKR